MKRTIYTLLLLIGAVALTTACDKSNMTGSKTANVIGKWAIESVEFYYDGQKVNYNPNVNCIAYIDSDGLMQLGFLHYGVYNSQHNRSVSAMMAVFTMER